MNKDVIISTLIGGIVCLVLSVVALSIISFIFWDSKILLSTLGLRMVLSFTFIGFLVGMMSSLEEEAGK